MPTETALRLRRIRAENPGWSTAKNARWKAKNREKYLAHKAVEYAVKVGRLVRGPCEVDGCEGKSHAHHDDYSKPLEVRWLCQKHHEKQHH